MNSKTGKIIMICVLIFLAIIFLPKLFPNLSGNNFAWLIFLLCPLMHIFMMKGMHNKKHDHNEHGGHSCCGGYKNEEPKAEEIKK